MTRDTAINIIKRTITQKYGREKMTRICEIEGWLLPDISRLFSEKNTDIIPKKFLQFAGLESVKEITYRRKEK